MTRRAATSIAFAALFFAGASFSAVAGDALVDAVEATSAGTETAETATTDEAQPAEAVPAPEPEPAPELPPAQDVRGSEPPSPAHEASVAEELSALAPPAGETPAPDPVLSEPQAAPETMQPSEPELVVQSHEVEEAPPEEELRPLAVAKPRPAAVPETAGPTPVQPQPKRAPRDYGHLDPEVGLPGTSATVWLNRTAPDPTPAALRLAPEFAARLVREADKAGVDWALVLGVLRAEGARGRVPVRLPTVAEASERLAELGARREPWAAALAFTGRTAGADRAVALARYYRAVGFRALVDGLRAQEDALVERVLSDPRVDLYDGGRADLEARRIDVRVVALIAYLAEAYGQVTVTSLFTGHRVYARPGVVSAHMFGAAVDVAVLGGVALAGNQRPGGLVERAVRDILLLPTEMRPRQVISLLGLGGPSFPLADHADHIHVGF